MASESSATDACPEDQIPPDEASEPIDTTKAWFDFLPDELVLLTLESVPSEYRDPLNLTCKRFRRLNKSKAKKFDRLIFDWRLGRQRLTCISDGKEEFNDDPLAMSPRQIDSFLYAATDMLIVRVHVPCEKPVFDIIAALFRSVTYQTLLLQFCVQPWVDAERVITALTRGRNLEHAEVQIHSMGNYSELTTERNALSKLPKMARCLVEWEQIITDDALLNLIANTDRFETKRSGVCPHLSAQAIVDAFEIICASSDIKFAKFQVRAAIGEEVFRLAEEKELTTKQWPNNSKSVNDRSRNSAMQLKYEPDDRDARKESVSHYRVAMYKIDRSNPMAQQSPFAWVCP